LDQWDSMLALHERLLSDLDRRDASIGEQENEARRALEQALARCASERSAIAQEKAVLVQAQQLYRRFLGTPPATAATMDQVAQPSEMLELVDSSVEAPVVLAEQGQVAVAPAGFDPGPDFENRIRELRSGLRDQFIAEEKAEQKATKWSGPLRGLLNPGS
jgi:hypothetical protein